MTIPTPVVHASAMPRFSRPFMTLLGKEVARFMTVVVQTIITPLVTAGLYLTIFVGGLGGRLEGIMEGVSYMDYLVPGLVMMGAINHSFNNAASSFMISKFQNNLIDVLVTPLTDLEIACAYGFASVGRGVLVGVLTWLVAVPFGGPIPEHPALALLVLAVGSLVFAFLGVSAGVYGSKFDDIARISTFIILPLTYLGGVFIPITSYPDAVQGVAAINPLLYAIDGLHLTFLSRSNVGPLAVTVVITLSLLTTLCLALVALRYSKAIRN